MTLVQTDRKRGTSRAWLAASSSYPFVQRDLGEGPGALVQVQAELLQAQLLLQEMAQVPLQEVPTGPLLDGLRKRPRHDEVWQLGRRAAAVGGSGLGAQGPAPGRGGVSWPRRGLSPGRPLHACSAPGGPAGRPHPLCRAARSRSGKDKGRRSLGPRRISARVLVRTPRGCKRARGDAAGPEGLRPAPPPLPPRDEFVVIRGRAPGSGDARGAFSRLGLAARGGRWRK